MNWIETRAKLVELLPGIALPEWSCDANLSRANLRRANLRGADLSEANLSRANLRGANLRGAYLRGAYLRGADLRGADLRGANLRGADLGEADLSRAYLDWNSHQVVAEILRQEASNDVEKRKLGGLVLISLDWCWKDFLALDEPLKEWALGILAKYVQEGDNAPDVLKERV